MLGFVEHISSHYDLRRRFIGRSPMSTSIHESHAGIVQELARMREQDFIETVYLLLLGRPVDPSGRWNLLTRLARGASREQLAAEIFCSEEGREYMAMHDDLRLYMQTFLEQSGALVGQASVLTVPAKSTSAVKIVSDENQRKPSGSLTSLLALDDAEFIAAAYLAILRRDADSSGLNSYLNLYRQGHSKVGILYALANSDEGRQVGVKVDGLQEAISKYRFARLPIVGWLVRKILDVEAETSGEWAKRAEQRAGGIR